MSILFEPKPIGSLVLKNRFIKSSTAERMAGPDGEVAPALVEFCEAIARGGAGCIFLGHAYVHPKGRRHAGPFFMRAVMETGQMAAMGRLCKKGVPCPAVRFGGQQAENNQKRQ